MPSELFEKSTPQESEVRTVTVRRAGSLTTIQDHGRPGFAHLGVPPSGALDRPACSLANRLVGNPENAAVLETTLDGVALVFSADSVVAVTGALAPLYLDSAAVSLSLPVVVRKGQVLEVGTAVAGVRSYIAVGGGLRPPLTLGSAATDLLSGLGPPPLRRGETLLVGPSPEFVPAVDLAPYPIPATEIELLVHHGPREEWLTREGLARLYSERFIVAPASNRIALRLIGREIRRRHSGELPSEGMVSGAVQCLPSGQLVILLADHPTTGGYPVVGVLDPASLPLCGQARPGTALRFTRAGRSR